MKALFVTSANSLGQEGRTKGGVQVCTHEYLNTIRAAGFETTLVTFDTDQRFMTRVKRRLFPKPFKGVIPPTLYGMIVNEARKTSAQIVFLNAVDLAELAEELRQALGSGVKLVLLSHGLHSADLLHKVRIESSGHAPTAHELTWLAAHLMKESEQRKYLDHIFTLADFEVGLERWLGARSVSWLPRIVEPRPLDWQPISGRYGFVGTLDHHPNTEGLHLFLQAMERLVVPGRIRIVGGPLKTGKEFVARYPTVDYLGQLSDQEVALEAATWTAAIHPLFCYPRGCSTKLAIYLGWQIPVLATPQGCRGYVWKEGNILQARDPNEMVRLVLAMNNLDEAKSARTEIIKVSNSSPTLQQVADSLASTLSPLFSQDWREHFP